MKKCVMLTFLVVLITVFTKYTNTAFSQTSSDIAKLESILVENKEVLPDENNIINVREGDAIRLSLIGTPGAKIKLFFDDKTYEGVFNDKGVWFTLFSMPSPENREYKIEARTNTDGVVGEKVSLVTIRNYASNEMSDTDRVQNNVSGRQFKIPEIIIALIGSTLFIIYLLIKRK